MLNDIDRGQAWDQKAFSVSHSLERPVASYIISEKIKNEHFMVNLHGSKVFSVVILGAEVAGGRLRGHR